MKRQGRLDRREKCKQYLKRAGNLPAAQELAAREGFSQNTSVWIGALGEMLDDLNEAADKKSED